MSLPSASPLPPLAALAVRALFLRRATNSRWQPYAWQLAAVMPPETDTGTDTEDEARGDAVLEVHRDEGEGYWLNLSTEEPSVFVLWRPDDEALECPRPVVQGATLSYNEAARWMDAGERVERLPMEPAMRDWLAEFVERTWQPETKRKKKGAPRPSFLSREDFGRLAEREGRKEGNGDGV